MIVQFILALATLIFIHELGHFIAARLFKIDVEEFGIGFPPRALTLFEAGGTKFTLNWIPLGGFVRPKGENDPNVPGGLAAASPWVRISVYLAGPLMNLLTAVVIYTIVYANLGAPDPSRANMVAINAVVNGSVAQAAGLKENDVIYQVNDQELTGVDSLIKIIHDNAGTPLTLYYYRGDQIGELTITPKANSAGDGEIGVVIGAPSVPLSLPASIRMGAQEVYLQARNLFTALGQVVRGSQQDNSVRFVGIKGLYDIFSNIKQTESQIPTSVPRVGLLELFGFVSFSLGLLNLFPIPALDGGRIVFALPEIILRRRIPPEYENVINLVSFALLLILLIYINLQDFINPLFQSKP